MGCNSCACTIADSLHPRSRRPSCREHDPIRFLRLPSQRPKPPLQHPLQRFTAQAHFPYEHLRHLGGWFSTPGSLRRKSLLKVHFDNMTSDSAISDANTGAKDGKYEVPLPEADWDAGSSSRPGVSDSISEPSFNHVESSSPAPGSSTLASRDGQEADGPTANSPTETTNHTTTVSSPHRKSRRSPSV